MLTKEAAAERAARMSDQELEHAIDSIGASPDASTLGVAAVNVKAGRAQAAAAEAQRTASIEAARRAARLVWEQAGSPGSFDTFFEQRQRQAAHERLDSQRAAMRHIYAKKF